MNVHQPPKIEIKSLKSLIFNGFSIKSMKIKKIQGFGLSPRLGRLRNAPKFFILLNKTPQDSIRAGSEHSILQTPRQKLQKFTESIKTLQSAQCLAPRKSVPGPLKSEKIILGGMDEFEVAD